MRTWTWNIMWKWVTCTFPAHPRGSHINMWLMWSSPHYTVAVMWSKYSTWHATKNTAKPHPTCSWVNVTFLLFCDLSTLPRCKALGILFLSLTPDSVHSHFLGVFRGGIMSSVQNVRNHTVFPWQSSEDRHQNVKQYQISSRFRENYSLSWRWSADGFKFTFSHSYPAVTSVCQYWLANHVCRVSSHSLIRLVWWHSRSKVCADMCLL